MTGDGVGGPERLLLGTAMWGWSVGEDAAFAMLDAYTAAGGQWVDTAVNYPINGEPGSYGLALRFLSDWLAARPGSHLSVWVKVGSLDNAGSAEVNLAPSAILVWEELLRQSLGGNLRCLGVHWDPREDPFLIAETVHALASLQGDDLHVGLSGLTRPDLYAAASSSLPFPWWVQVKENLHTRASRLHAAAHLSDARYFAYGINGAGRFTTAGSVQAGSTAALRGLSSEHVELPMAVQRFMQAAHIESVAQLALMFAASNKYLDGVLIGPRTVAQLEANLHWWSLAENGDYAASFEALASELEPDTG